MTHLLLHITGYKFIYLADLESLQANFFQFCNQRDIKGTILLSNEGINLNLTGLSNHILDFQKFLQQHSPFADISFRTSYAYTQPFKRLKIKLKKEIITFKQETINPCQKRASFITPLQLKQWLDNKNPLTLLDTRNDYEIQFGSFANAINLQLKHFTDFPAVIEKIEKDKPIVTFCTGGIRCEKSALYLLAHGFSEVYQLEGGILNYFAEAGNSHYQGSCFVFDDRVCVDAEMMSSPSPPTFLVGGEGEL